MHLFCSRPLFIYQFFSTQLIVCFFSMIFAETQEVHKKKLTMSFEEYKNLSNMLILYMRNEETRAETDTGIEFETIIDDMCFGDKNTFDV